MKRSSTTLIDDVAPEAKRSVGLAEEKVVDATTESPVVAVESNKVEAAKPIVVKSWAVGLGICDDAEVHVADEEQTTYSHMGAIGKEPLVLNLDLASVHPRLVKSAHIDTICVTNGSLVTFQFTDDEGEECEAHARLVQYELIPGTGVPPPCDQIYYQMLHALTGLHGFRISQKGERLIATRRDGKRIVLASSAEDLIAKSMPSGTEHERGHEFDSIEFVWNDKQKLEAHAIWGQAEDGAHCAWVFVKRGDLLVCL